MIYLKTYLERDNVPQATSESSDTTETQGVTPGSPSQELGESDKFRPGVRSEEKLLASKPSDDATTWQSDTTPTLHPSRVIRPHRLEFRTML